MILISFDHYTIIMGLGADIYFVKYRPGWRNEIKRIWVMHNLTRTI